ncbi:MAG: CPBP family intramembrane glutamic endopeptidase [Actinomycetota bacterium]
MPAIGFVGFYFSLLVGALVLGWLYLVSRSILVVAVFHAVFDIATNTPTTTTLLPALMGAAVTVAGLATIGYLARAGPKSDADMRPDHQLSTSRGDQDDPQVATATTYSPPVHLPTKAADCI